MTDMTSLPPSGPIPPSLLDALRGLIVQARAAYGKRLLPQLGQAL
jgi:hypothetical protein